MLSVKYASAVVWQEVCKKVKGAVVFLDEPSGECLSWHGGFELLRKSGAVAVKEFSSFESGEDIKKAVFLVATPLTGPTRVILRDLISNSRFQYCILITSCSPSVLTLATTGNVSENTDEMTAVHKLETDILHWMRNKEFTVEIFHLFTSCVPISDTFFTFPQFSHIFPCFSEDLEGKTLYSTLPRNLDLEALPLELQVGVIHMMTTLNSLLSKLNARESIYCMGMLSSLVGSQLQKHATSALRLKNAEHNVSVILIDRNLDLCGPLMALPSSQNCMIDQMKNRLPPFPMHSVDVAVDMSPLCFGTSVDVDGFSAIAPGCLHDPPSDWMDTLINCPIPEIIPYVYRKIAAVLSIDDIPAKITSKDLQELLKVNFDKNYDNIKNNLGLVQVALGILSTINSENISTFGVVESVQKMLFQSIAAENGTGEAMQHLIQIVLERRDRGLTVDSIFLLLVFLYSLIGQQFSVDEYLEKSLKDVILEMITEEVTKINHSSKLIRKIQEDMKIEQFCDKTFIRLNALRNCRQHLDKYKTVSKIDNTALPLEYESIINQVLYDIVDVTKPDIPDLKFKANISLRNNFTSRFSMILNTAKPHIMDNDVILVFVIGGITGHEVKHITNIFRLYGKQVIVGSTTLLSPSQVLDNMFIHDPLRPFIL